MSFAILITLLSVPLVVQGSEPPAKTVWEDFSSPQYTATWGDYSAANAGKWSGFYIPAWQTALKAENFSSSVPTPSGDNFSANADMSFLFNGDGAMLRKDNAVGTQVNTTADGFYITMYSNSNSDIALRIRNDATNLGVGQVMMYTIIELQTGWHTYYIPYSSIVHKSDSGFTDGTYVSAWTLGANNFQSTTTPFEYFGLVNAQSSDTASNRTNFKGQTIKRELSAAPSSIIIDEIGFYTGDAPVGQVEDAPIPVVYNALETYSSPLWASAWDNIDQANYAGKWQAYSIGGIGDGNFSDITPTPSGDDFSMTANMTGNSAMIRKTHAAGTKYDINADGFYITMSSDKAGYIILRTYLQLYDTGAGTHNYFTIIEVEEGWKTYFIPYTNIIRESGDSAVRDGSNYGVNWNMGSTLTANRANTDFRAFALTYRSDLSTLAENRIDFRGNVTTTALPSLGGCNITIDEYGYFSGDMPAGQVADAELPPVPAIPLRYQLFEDCANPQLGGEWGGVETFVPGKWYAYNLGGSWSDQITSDAFSDSILTPSGDSASLTAAFTANEAAVTKKMPAGTKYLDKFDSETDVDGFYITMYSDIESDLIFCVNMLGTYNWMQAYTILEVKDGWHTYFIPYNNLVLRDGSKDSSNATASGTLADNMNANSTFDYFRLDYSNNSSTTDTRTNFKGQKIQRALAQTGPTVVVDELGYFAGTMPAGQIMEATPISPVILKGDVDGDGFVDERDVALLAEMLLKNEDLPELGSNEFACANVHDDDNVLDILDLLALKQLILETPINNLSFDISRMTTAENVMTLGGNGSMKPGVASVPARAGSTNGMRVCVDNANPLFLFFPKVNTQNPSDVSSIQELYNLLPADIREYSAFVLWGTVYRASYAAFKAEMDPALTKCDQLGIPSIVLAEFWNTAANDTIVRGNQTVTALTETQIDQFYIDHPKFLGIMHFELSAMHLQNDEINRMKTSLKSAIRNDGMLFWVEGGSMNSPSCITDALNRDQDFYNLCSQNSKNVIFMDKENGHGMRFSNTSSALGGYIADCADNWGVAFENWSWWEEGMGKSGDMGGKSRETLPEAGVAYYQPSMVGMTAYQKISAGATVFTAHEVLRTFISEVWGSNNGQLKTSPAFDDMLYPIYQKILTESLIPTKAEVKSRLKAAYVPTQASKVTSSFNGLIWSASANPDAAIRGTDRKSVA